MNSPLGNLFLALCLLCCAAVLAGGPGQRPSDSGHLPGQALRIGSEFSPKDTPDWMQALLQRIALENIPHEYEDTSDWGKQDQRFDGLHIRRDKLRIRTKRKWKQVNHGTWRKYHIRQIDPASNLRVRVENIYDAGDGNVGFELSLTSKLHAFARMSKWAKGVQLWSLSIDADTDVRMRIWCHVGLRIDPTRIPPDVLLEPKVTRAELEISDFRLQSLSKMDGPLAGELGRGLEGVLARKLEEKRAELPEKINGLIASNSDKLRFSPSQVAVEKWRALTRGRQNAPADAEPTTSAGLVEATEHLPPAPSGPLLVPPTNAP